MDSQRAAEHLVKGIAVRRYIEPRKSRNIAAIANDLRHQKPQDLDTKLWSAFADRIAALDGFSLRDNQTAYAVTAPNEQTIQRTCRRVGHTLVLFADEVASAFTPPDDLLGMGHSPKRLGNADYRERLQIYAGRRIVRLQQLCSEIHDVLRRPTREKGRLIRTTTSVGS
ncbi:MAG: hypothetical protein OXC68_00955 [Aestuariivita sp.]|nr:hypothetical protein [Aestuariivita sp.]